MSEQIQASAGPKRLSRPNVPPRASSVVPIHKRPPPLPPLTPKKASVTEEEDSRSQTSPLQKKTSPPPQMNDSPSTPTMTMQLRNPSKPPTRSNTKAVPTPPSPSPRPKSTSPKPPVPAKRFTKKTAPESNSEADAPRVNGTQNSTPGNAVEESNVAKDLNGESEHLTSDTNTQVDSSAQDLEPPRAEAETTAISPSDSLKSPTFGPPQTSTSPSSFRPRRPPKPKMPHVEINNNKINIPKPLPKKRSAKNESASAPSPKSSKMDEKDIPSRPSSSASKDHPDDDAIDGDEGEEEKWSVEDDQPVSQGEEDEELPSPDPAESSLNVDELGNLLDDDGNIIGHRDAKVKSTFTPKPKPTAEEGKRENADSGRAGSPSDIFLDIKSTKDCIQIIMRIPTTGFGKD